ATSLPHRRRLTPDVASLQLADNRAEWPTWIGECRSGPYRHHACRRPASRPPRTARTGNGPNLTVKARSQPGPTMSTEPDYLRAGIHAEDTAIRADPALRSAPKTDTAAPGIGQSGPMPTKHDRKSAR